MLAVEVLQSGGFVGTKRFVDCLFHLGSDVDCGGEAQQNGFFGGSLRVGFRAEAICDLEDGLMVFGRQFDGLAGAEIVGCGIGRASGFAFRSARSGGPLGVAPVRC